MQLSRKASLMLGGAFIAAHASVVEWLLQKARPYIYTTASAPALAHALLTSLDIIGGQEGSDRRSHLASLIAQLRRDLTLRNWKHPSSETAIQPIIIGGNDETLRAAAALYEQGLWVAAIRPPTVAAGTARLRLTLSAAHTFDDVQQVVAAIKHLESEI